VATSVLVIPEDFRKDQYVLKPIVEQMMKAVGVKARVQVCKDPLLGGIDQALKWERLAEIIDRYKGMTQLFLLVVDRDCVVTRRATLDALEVKATEILGDRRCVFFGEHAWQELEVWILAGQTDLPSNWTWRDIRNERDPKETYYDRYAEQRGMLTAAYEGREVLAKEAARNYTRIRQLCPEDVGQLEQRITDALRK
jgi:hypothetical protein